MPSYNLPSYPTLGVTSTVTTTTSITMDSAAAPASPSGSRRRPAPLAIVSQRAPPLFVAPPLSPNNAASVKHPFARKWVPSPWQYRSPLSVVNSGDSDYDNQFRLAQQATAHRAHRAPSRRYVRPPPKSASSVLQEFSILPRMLGEGGTENTRQKVYEDLVARTLERRLREKARRSVIGERAGLGVAPGREMLMMASLGSVRQAQQRRTEILNSPTSAPPTQESFAMNASPLQPDPPSAVKLQRALGHRKSVSAAPAVGPPSTSPNSPKLGAAVPSLNTIKGFIARRTPKNSNEDQDESSDEDDTKKEKATIGNLPKLSYVPPSTTFKNRIVPAPVIIDQKASRPIEISVTPTPISAVIEIHLPETNEKRLETSPTKSEKPSPHQTSAPPTPPKPIQAALSTPVPASPQAKSTVSPPVTPPKAPLLAAPVNMMPVPPPSLPTTVSKPKPSPKSYGDLSLPSRPPRAARAPPPMERRHSSSPSISSLSSVTFPSLPPASAQGRPSHGRSFSERHIGSGMMGSTISRDWASVRMPSPVAMESSAGAGDWSAGCRNPPAQTHQSFASRAGGIRMAFAVN